MLQDVDWGLSVEEKDTFREEIMLLLCLLLLLRKLLHFRSLLELLRYLVFV